MDSLYCVNANDVGEAYESGLQTLKASGEVEKSERGDVIVLPAPLVTVYKSPQYRVLFAENRNPNPFFHLVESVWMLAGRDDARFLDKYVHDFSSRYAEDGNGTLWGAYGKRWRSRFGEDQISTASTILMKEPRSRRAVITMWHPFLDLRANKKDIPCNTHIYFRRREEGDKLDMMVCCRSNDLIWGAYGANAVHMSVLQEIVAGLTGCEAGTYTQLSFNAHAYIETLERATPARRKPYAGEPLPILQGDTTEARREEAERLLDKAWEFLDEPKPVGVPWLDGTVLPMMKAHKYFREGDFPEAENQLCLVQAADWREAGKFWLSKRVRKGV